MMSDWLKSDVPGRGGGPVLVPYGPHQSDADLTVFVCFDCSTLFVFGIAAARRAVERAHPRFRRYGSGNGNSKRNTGYGVLLLPQELGAHCYIFVSNARYDNWSLSQRAVMAVREYCEAHDWPVHGKVTRAEDIAGTDLRVEIEGVEKKIQVKSRRANKRYSRLFIQTHEANPEKIYQ